jgi:hypothetical protein
MQAIQQNNLDQVHRWTFAPGLILAGKLSVHDNGPDERFVDTVRFPNKTSFLDFFAYLNLVVRHQQGLQPDEPAQYPIPVTAVQLGNGEIALGFELSQFHHGRYKRTHALGAHNRNAGMVYHPHARRPLGDHSLPCPFRLRWHPDSQCPLGQMPNKRRPKAVGSVALEVQLSRRVDDTL